MADESGDRKVTSLYAPEGRSAFYQWRRQMLTNMGNATLLWMADHFSKWPEDKGHRWGARLGPLMPLISRRHYRIVLTNMRLAFPEKSEAELKALAHACYVHLGKCLMEFIRFPRMSAEDIKRVAELRGAEKVHEALARGKGIVLLTAHVGNWEMAGARLAAEGFPVVAIARAQKDSALTDYLSRAREATGMRISHRESAVKAGLRALKNNELLGVLMDQNAGQDGLFVDFFGHLASTAPGAAWFALKTDAAVLTTFDHRTPDDRHVVELGGPVPLLRTGDNERDLWENTAQFTKLIENQIRAYPEQWFWLHKRWKARPAAEAASQNSKGKSQK